MGVWEGTCMATELPIFYGEKIKFCFIMETGKISPSGHVYPEDGYSIVSPFFDGKYDSYGRVYDICDDAFNFVLNFQRFSGFEIVNPDDYYLKDISEFEEKSVEEAIVIIERDMLALDGKAVGIAMVKEDAFRYFVKNGYEVSRESVIGNVIFEDMATLSQLQEIKKFVGCMSNLRKVIGPKSGKGGQEYEMDSYLKYANFYKSSAKKCHQYIGLCCEG